MYLRPTAFIDSPVGLDGQCARLAGGPIWFSAVQVLKRDGPPRLVPIERLDDARHAFADRDRFDRLWTALTSPRAPLTYRGWSLPLDRPSVVGIVNVTPDSFSDGGRRLAPDAAATAARAMLEAGAALVDLGAESTRPGAHPLPEHEELARLRPVLDRLSGVPISIDTRKAAIAASAVEAGALMVNDVSALTYDPRMRTVVSAGNVPIVLMHHQGTPETMQAAPAYVDVVFDVFDWLETRIAASELDPRLIVVDPGIGFGKTLRHNLKLLNGLSMFHGLGCAIMLGASRKGFIGTLSHVADAHDRLAGSLAVLGVGLAQGVQLFRVHDVAESMQAIRVWHGLRNEAFTPG